jgi:hypothetical protein
MDGLDGGNRGSDSFVFDLDESFGDDVIHDFEDDPGGDCDVLVLKGVANTDGGDLDTSSLDAASHSVSGGAIDSDVTLTFVALDAAINMELYL